MIEVAMTHAGRWKYRFRHNSMWHSDGQTYPIRFDAVLAAREHEASETHEDVWERIDE